MAYNPDCAPEQLSVPTDTILDIPTPRLYSAAEKLLKSNAIMEDSLTFYAYGCVQVGKTYITDKTKSVPERLGSLAHAALAGFSLPFLSPMIFPRMGLQKLRIRSFNRRAELEGVARVEDTLAVAQKVIDFCDWNEERRRSAARRLAENH